MKAFLLEISLLKELFDHIFDVITFLFCLVGCKIDSCGLEPACAQACIKA